MPSIIDTLFAQQGWVDPAHRGVTVAHAGALKWQREPGESEPQFLSRACREAAAAGFRVVSIGGHLQADEPPPAADAVRFVYDNPGDAA